MVDKGCFRLDVTARDGSQDKLEITGLVCLFPLGSEMDFLPRGTLLSHAGSCCHGCGWHHAKHLFAPLECLPAEQ